MKHLFLFLTSIIFLTLSPVKTYATHGLPIVGLTGTVGGGGLTVTGGSDAATCGSGPYWMQVEIVCTAGGLTGTPPATLQTTLANGAGGATTFNSFPWYNSLLNIPTMNAANGWSDGCVAGEQYHNVVIPFTGLCPGQTYYWAAREWVSASNSPGPWSAVQSFVVPGVFNPVAFNISASPSTYCLPGNSTLSVTGITGGCGNQTIKWSTGATTANITVSPAATTVYQCTVSAPCMPSVVKSVTVTVVPVLSAAFVPTNTTICNGASQVFTHTGTAGVNHNWSVSPAAGVTISTPTSTNPSITFANAGSYVVSHTVSAGSCTNVVTTNITVNSVTSPFTIPSATQCLTGNSFSFNNIGTAGGTHSYTFSPTAGSPASGGTANYSGSFTAPGTYSVTHTVTLGACVSVTTQTVVVNPMPAATLTFTNPTCGNNNGAIFITNTSPGIPPQTVTGFASSLGSVNGQTVTGLGAGTPVITLTNNFGCTYTVSATLTSSSGPTNVVLTPNNIICGTGTGSITIGAVTGGLPGYTYNVNGGTFSASPPVTGLTSGTYTIGVKDASGCIYTKTVAITVTTGPTAIAGTSTPAGCGLTNGTYNITGVTGGVAAYSFSVDAVASGSLTSNLAPGTHSVSVKDGNGCSFNTTFVVGSTSGPSTATITTANASCGSSNGSATVTTVTGGLAPYQYSFDGGGFTTTTNASGLAAATHTLVIKDANSCTLTVTYNILNTGSPTASVTNSLNVSCFGGSNGSFTVTPVGGVGPAYTYTLASPYQTNGTGQFSGLPAGTYNITVKDQVGCVTTTSTTITEPTVLTLTPSSIQVKCFGTATGTVNVVGAGGTPTYSYNLNGGAYQASSTFANQFSGVYSIGIKDANGCIATQTVTVAQPSALNIAVSSQNANCTAANGIGSSTVTGGTGAITYSWTPTGGAANISNGVIAGNYTVTATDANGCIVSSPVTIGLTPGGTASITALTNVSCNGACNGSMTAGMTGGAAPFTYAWSPGGQTNSTATNLCPGTYTCEITDFYGCKAITVGTITQPVVLSAIMNSNNVKCFGTATGTVTAAGTGGTGPYTYLWTTIPSTLASVSNVSIGTYSCIITDVNGCAITQSISVTQPSSITLTSSVTTANCNQANGSATITINGGSSPYSQIWSSGSTLTTQSSIAAGTYTINVQDANNCSAVLAVTVPNLSGPTISITSQTNVSCFAGNNGVATAVAASGNGPYIYAWSHGPNTPTATNLTVGVYTVSATDQAGCIASTNVTITEPTALTVAIVPTNPKCFGSSDGAGLAAASGGTPTYSYTWTNGTSGSSITGLNANNYGLTVTDGNGCIVTSSMSLVNPLAMSASISSTSVTCFGLYNGTAIATSTNGIGAISYYWTGTPSPVSSQTLTGVAAGSYTVLATDQHNCTASAQVTIIEPTQVTANISSTGSVTCNGGNNGFAVVTPGGGMGAFSYAWSPSGGNLSTANNLVAGVYVVTVSDANLCSATATATIIQPTPLATTLTTTDVKCNGACDGTANIAYAGGAGTTTFLWQPGLQSGNTVNNLCAGGQTVTITSNAACPTILTFTLTEPAALTAVISSTNSNCGQANGKTCVVVGGGTAPYNSLWSNGVTTLCNNSVVAGPYTYSVTDGNGCTAVAIGNISDIAGPVVTILSSTPVSCFGGSNGAATATVTGGVSPYSVSWTGTQASANTTFNPIDFGVGPHAITVNDAAGCVGTASVNITEPTQLVSAMASFTNVTCNGLSNGGATLLVNGGTTPYTYTWTPGNQSSSILVNVPANTYTANVSDGNGCLTSQQVTISEPAALVMTASSFTNITCFGANNGQISTTVQGGAPPYSYVWSPVVTPTGGYISGLSAGAYSLQTTDNNGCSINANFTITEPAILTSTYTSLPATCGLSNGSATLTLSGGTPVYNVVWNLSGTPTGLSAANMPPGPTTANITDSKGCAISQVVTIANPPVPVISGFVTTPPKCFGMLNGDITINYASGTAPYNVSWSNPISQTTSSSAFTQSVSGISAGAYTATLTDSYGCSTSQPVVVSQPNMLVLIPSSSVTICYGMSTQINAAGSGGTAPYTYSWTPNTLNGGGPHTVSPLTNTVYIVSVEDANGCSQGPKVINVNVKAPLVISATQTTICHGGSTILTPTITSVGNGGPYTYVWTPVISNTNSITVVGNAPTTVVTNTYAVTIDDGCTIPTASATAVFTVIVNPLPVVTFTADVLKGCAPLMVTLSATSDGANDLYTWGDIGNGQGNPKVITIPNAGLYSVSLFVVNPTTGCRKDTTRIDYLEVYPQPIASFYAVPPTTSILTPHFDFVNTSQGATTYYWDFGDPAATSGSNTSVLMNPGHDYSYVGEYKVNLVATSDKGCVDIVSILVEVTPDFALYIPNAFTPDGNGVNDIFQPMGVGIDEDNYRMDIFDRWGESIFTSNNFRKGWDGSVKGSSKSAPQGVYTYKLMVVDTKGNKHPQVGHVTVIRQTQ